MAIRTGRVESSDGTGITYQVRGHGPALVLSNGLTTTSTFWKHLAPRWSQHHTVVTWDLPGHGSSEPARTKATASIEAQPQILARVMDAAGVDRAVQIGFSVGCQVVLEMYRQLPARCEALVALLGGAGNALSSTQLPIPGSVLLRTLKSTPDGMFASALRLFARAANGPLGIPVGRSLGLLGSASDSDLREMTEHLTRLDPATLRAMAISAESHSTRELLPHISVPFLIVAGDKDPFAPSERVGVPLQRAAPGSELVRLPRGTHTALLDETEAIARSVESFLTRLARTGAQLQ